MKLYLMLIFLVMLPEMPALAETFEWKDDAGGVHFTDNPESIPAKYRNRVRERESVGGGEVKTFPPAPLTSPAKEVIAPAGPESYGGHPLSWWRSGYAGLKGEQERLQKEIEEQREKVNTLHRKRLIFERASDRTALNQAREELARKEASAEELRTRMTDLEAEANKAGVPTRWQEGK